MSSELATQIRGRLSRYLSGQGSLEEFDTWFTPATWDVERQGDQEAEVLADEIMLRLAEFSRGHWTEAELKARLRETHPECLQDAQPVHTQSTSSVPGPTPVDRPGASGGTGA